MTTNPQWGLSLMAQIPVRESLFLQGGIAYLSVGKQEANRQGFVTTAEAYNAALLNLGLKYLINPKSVYMIGAISAVGYSNSDTVTPSQRTSNESRTATILSFDMGFAF